MIVVHPSTAAAAEAEVRVGRALISVFDKRGLIPFARALADLKVELVATGGTASLLAEAGLRVVPVEELTGFPELLEGRVKSLHPAVHAGILFQRHLDSHRAEVEAMGIRAIDLVAVSLYPFSEARARSGELAELVEHIDIGGPAMVRAAAKNFAHVGVVVGPHQYDAVARELRDRDGALSGSTRRRLAAEAFSALAAYDGEIGATLSSLGSSQEAMPPVLQIHAALARTLRYGENPHQGAAFYASGGARGLADATVHQGRDLSFTNLLDLDAALLAIEEFPRGGCVVIKHASPSGLAVAATPVAAFRLARDCDPLSAFGGVIGFAGPVDGETAAEIGRDFYEAVVAPAYTPEARAALAAKPVLRVVEVGEDARRAAAEERRLRSVLGGYLLEDADRKPAGDELPGEVATRRAPTAEERRGLHFAFKVAKLVRSNAIVFARGECTVGIGAGQASRIDAVEVAAMKAARCGHDLKGAVMASDAFFPFPDAVEAAGRLGISAVVQPGGSRRDPETIAAADRLGIAMVMSGERHFVH
jgi:phosphoribosylaminoimidazolecarboxamide formyltransferase/IMP cyclohydrolase